MSIPKPPAVLKDDGTWNVNWPGGTQDGDSNWTVIINDTASPNLNKKADEKDPTDKTKILKRNPTTATATRFWDLQFTSESNTTVFGLVGNAIDPGDTKIQYVVLALKDDPLIKPSFTLEEVLTKFGVDAVKAENKELIKILSDDVLKKSKDPKPQCTLRTSSSNKSGIWFTPGDSVHTVTVKLSFTMAGDAANLLATKFVNTEYGLNLTPDKNAIVKITLQQDTKYTIGPVVVSNAKKEWKIYMTFPIPGFDVWLTFAKEKTIFNLMDQDTVQKSLFDRLGESVFPSSSTATADLLLQNRRIENPIKPRTIQSFFVASPEPLLWSVTVAKEEVKDPTNGSGDTTRARSNAISTGQDVGSIIGQDTGRDRSNAVSGNDSSTTLPKPADSGNASGDSLVSKPKDSDNSGGSQEIGSKSDDKDATNSPTVYRVTWEIKYISKLSFSDGSIPLVGLTYSSKEQAWTGKLLFSITFPDGVKKRLPAWNPVDDVPPSARDIFVRISSVDGKLKPNPNGKSPLPDNLNIWTAFGIEQYQPPPWLPSLIQDGSVVYGDNQDGLKTMGLDFTIINPPKKVVAPTTSTKDTTTKDTATKDTAKDATEVPHLFELQKCRIKIFKISSKDASKVKTEVLVSATIALNPRPAPSTTAPAKKTPALTPVTMQITVAYQADSGATSWFVGGGITNLSAGLIHNFVDPSVKEGVMAILDKLTLKTFNIAVTFSDGGATSFFIYGSIAIGELALDLSYQYCSTLINDKAKTAAEQVWENSTPKGPPGTIVAVRPEKPNPENKDKPIVKGTIWAFEAYLGASGVATTTIGKIAKSIMGSEVDDIPPFVYNIEVEGGKNQLMKLKLTKLPPPSPDSKAQSVVFAFSCKIKGLMLTFSQIARSKEDGTSVPPKRALRFSCDAFPEIPNIPVMDKMPQPWKELLYLWVSKEGNGFTAKELEILNKQLLAITIPDIKYKALTKNDSVIAGAPNDPQQAEPVVLLAGHHFMVLDNSRNVVLDHPFNSKDSTPNGTRPRAGAVDATPEDSRSRGGTELTPETRPRSDGVTNRPADLPAPQPADDDDEDDDDVPSGRPRSNAISKPTKGAVDVKTSVLTVSSISFQMKTGGWLAITVDATVTLGPVSFTIIGFEIDVRLSSFKLDDLGNSISKLFTDKSLWKDTFDVNIKGLSVSFDKPPVLLAGLFIHDKRDTDLGSVESYRGGIALTILPYVIQAVGEYSILIEKDTKNEVKSVFIYGSIDGAIVTFFGVATLSGIKVGFGYNSAVRSPASMDEIAQNPFIAGTGSGSSGANPSKILDTMTGTGTASASKPWVTQKNGAYWLAAGFTITACEMLSVTMVALFAFPSGFGSGVIVSLYGNGIAQMPAKAPPNLTLIYIEISMSAEMNFVDGYLLIQAALGPSSHLWVPQCHLSGGAAVAYWFGRNPHHGDFVVTIGGYHPAYTPPTWYPVPRRLGLAFVVGDMIGIRGEAYFAVTPKCAMAGISFHMWLSIGPVGAYLDASADFFVQFDPLFFTGDVAVSVGVTFDMDFLFIHIHIEVHLGAELILWGPSFGGVAHVDFWLWGFDIRFGARFPEIDALKLEEFWQRIRSPGPDSGDKPADQAKKAETDPNMGNLKLAVEEGLFALPVRTSTEDTAPFPNAGQGSIWSVRGGPFQFRINCDMAFTEAKVADVDDADLPLDSFGNPGLPTSITNGWKDVNSVPVKKKVDDIHSQLMKLTDGIKVESTLEVIIFRESAKPIPAKATDPPNTPTKFAPEYLGVGGWRCEVLVAPVPQSIWGVYDSKVDPVRNKGAVDGAAGVTLQLCMGLSIKAPEPILAQSPIPDFDATAANLQRINTMDKIIPVSTIGDGSDEQANFLSTGVFQKNDQGDVRWPALKAKWETVAKNKLLLATNVLAACESILGWDERVKGQEGEEFLLKADTPTQLLNDLAFRYLELPSLGGGATIPAIAAAAAA